MTLLLERMCVEYRPDAKKKIVGDLKRELYHGWALPYLLQIDDMLHGRWQYWTEVNMRGEACDPIPQIEFLDTPNADTRKMLEACLNCIPNYGDWHGWSSSEYIRYFLQWLLYGFGNGMQKEQPIEPGGCEGASMRLYQLYDVGLHSLHPHDYFGYFLSETQYGKQNGFFPTPHSICTLMAGMTFGEEDCRTKSVCDPAVGTGRTLLHASNYSLCLFGQDVDLTMVHCTIINGYLYAPWLAVPLRFKDILDES